MSIPKSINGYKLKESTEGYAFYELEEKFGFKQGYEIIEVKNKKTKRRVYRVITLTGNSWGKGSWVIVNENYFGLLNDAIGYLEGRTRIYPPKRKPELIRPLTIPEICEILSIPPQTTN